MTQYALTALRLLRESIIGRPVSGLANFADAGRRAVHSGLLRMGLIAGCAISIGIALTVGDPSGVTHSDPALARLLRAMALIKGVIAVAAVAAVLWRFGRALSKPVAASYLLGCWLLVGSTMLIWQLAFIPLAAILFHAAAVSMLLVGWREE